MSLTLDDTIAAIASPAGPALRGIVRLSGPTCLSVVQKIVEGSVDWGFRGARSWDVAIPFSRGASLPVSLLLWPTGRSFTGQPVAELHLPGSLPLLNEVLRRSLAAGARLAEPGEFTLRAFLAGRIDLLQAEAVLGVIDAADSGDLLTALGQLAGGVSRPIAELHEELLCHLADLEAGLDFVEEDIDFVSRGEFSRRLDHARAELSDLRERSRQRMAGSGLPRGVLAGLPNAGKSTLFNALAGNSAALVSPIPGTTRDYLTAVVRSGNSAWELVDTAGWEVPRDGIEAAAASLRAAQLQQAQLIVWCAAPNLAPEEVESNRRLRAAAEAWGRPLLEVRTKCDLADRAERPILAVSAAAGIHLAELRQVIASRLSTAAPGSGIIATTAARCADSLEQAQQGVESCLALLAKGAGDELLAAELRSVLDQLGRIAGRISTDDLLDRIFSRFCIGK